MRLRSGNSAVDEVAPPPAPAASSGGSVNRARLLHELTNEQFAVAKSAYRLVTILYVVGLSIGLVAVTLKADKWVYALAGLSLLVQVLAWSRRSAGQRHHSYAQQIDWRAHIIDGLGETPGDGLDTSRMKQGAHEDAVKRAEEACWKPEEPRHFLSELPKGWERLRENLAQTAFVTESLYRSSAARANRIFWLLFVIVLSVGISALVLVGTADLNATKAFLVVLGFLPTWDAYGRAQSWGWAAERVSRVSLRLESADSVPRLVEILSDFIVACGMTPTIPPSLYSKREPAVKRDWEESRKPPMHPADGPPLAPPARD